jgi:hypothetical protein
MRQFTDSSSDQLTNSPSDQFTKLNMFPVTIFPWYIKTWVPRFEEIKAPWNMG